MIIYGCRNIPTSEASELMQFYNCKVWNTVTDWASAIAQHPDWLTLIQNDVRPATVTATHIQDARAMMRLTKPPATRVVPVLRLYDVLTDQFREPTQADIDRMMVTERIQGQFIYKMRRLMEGLEGDLKAAQEARNGEG